MATLTAPASEPLTDRRKQLILLLTCLGQFMVVLDIAIVTVALPAMKHSLDFSADRPAVGRQRLHADLCRVPAARRADRRHLRPAQDLPGRPGRVHGREPRVRPGVVAGGDGHGARDPGPGRGDPLARDADDPDRDVHRSPRAGARARHLECGPRLRRCHRRTRRRLPDRLHRLALDLPDQRADRHRRVHPRPARPAREQGRGRCPEPGRRRGGDRHRRADLRSSTRWSRPTPTRGARRPRSCRSCWPAS